MDITPEIYQLGSIAVIFVFAIREFFAYLRGKQPNGKKDEKQDISLAVVNEKLKNIETNHLPHIQKALEKNNDEHLVIIKSLSCIEAKVDILLKNSDIIK